MVGHEQALWRNAIIGGINESGIPLGKLTPTPHFLKPHSWHWSTVQIHLHRELGSNAGLWLKVFSVWPLLMEAAQCRLSAITILRTFIKLAAVECRKGLSYPLESVTPSTAAFRTSWAWTKAKILTGEGEEKESRVFRADVLSGAPITPPGEEEQGSN